MSDPKLAEAVRIVREKLVPIWFGLPIGLALETVLAALERAQGELAACDGHGYLRAEIERLRACVIYLERAGQERDEAMAEMERLRASALPDVVPEDVDALKAALAAEREANTRNVAELHRADALIGAERERSERLFCIMRMLVNGIDNWNASVEKIIGRPVAYTWTALEEARAALATAQPEEPPATTYGLCVCGTCPRCLYYASKPDERHWQDDAEPNSGRAQAAYQAQRDRRVLVEVAEDIAAMKWPEEKP